MHRTVKPFQDERADRSRVLQVATDALVAMERAMARDKIATNDRQLACARINSEEGQSYLKVWPAPPLLGAVVAIASVSVLRLQSTESASLKL
jgi:hypothetical protein